MENKIEFAGIEQENNPKPWTLNPSYDQVVSYSIFEQLLLGYCPQSLTVDDLYNLIMHKPQLQTVNGWGQDPNYYDWCFILIDSYGCHAHPSCCTHSAKCHGWRVGAVSRFFFDRIGV